MPLLGSFGAACARGLGLGNGEAPRVPTSVSVTAGVITITATYTITITTFPLTRVEYRIARGGDAGRYTGSLPGASGPNSSGTISTRVTAAGATENLVHATDTYTIFFRAVDASGQIGPETDGTAFTTGDEVAPTAATPVISSSQVSFPDVPFLSFTWSAGTAGTYPIGLRQYSVVAGNNPGAGTYTTMSGTSGTIPTITSTSSGAAILAQTQYTVYFKYTSTSPTLPAAFGTAYALHTTPNEVVASAPNSANLSRNTANETTQRTQIILSPGTITNSPTYNYKFEYALSTSNPPTNWEDWPNGKSITPITVSASPATTYYLRFKSVSLPPAGTVRESAPTGVASVTTRANVPPAPTLAWSGMSGSSYANPTFALTSNGGSTSSMRIIENGVGDMAKGLSTGTYTITRNYPSDGSTRTYYAVAVNVDGDSSSGSETRTWVLPTKNVAKTWFGNDFGQVYYFPDYTYVIKTNACEPYRLSYLFGPSGIPDDDNAPGYARVDRMQATFIPGTTLRRPGDNVVFSEASLANVSTLRFSYGTVNPGGTPTSASSVQPTNAFGGALTNFGGATTVFRYVSIGGSALHNKVFWAEKSDLGKSWNSGCILSTTGSYFAGKLFELVGVRTTTGSVN